MTKRVLLTGATGFIGSHLARKLVQDGHDVTAFVRPSCDFSRIEDLGQTLRFYPTDLSDPIELKELIAEIKPQWIFHLATYGDYRTETNNRALYQTNVMGTLNLLEACSDSGFEAFVNAGSSSEYGFKKAAPKETDLTEPNSHYAISKLAATQMCTSFAKSKNLPITTLRLYSVYGPHEEASRLIPTLIRKGLNGELPPLVDPDIARDFIYVEDVVSAFITTAQASIKEKGAIFNVGTGKQTTLKELVSLARREFSLKKKPSWGTMKNRRWDTQTWVANPTKMKTQLKWKPSFTVQKGFRATIGWAKKNDVALV